MKHIQKIFAVLIAMTMAMVLALPAFADSTPQDISTHTFAFYQIFSGTPNTEGGVTTWSDVAWATGAASGLYTGNDNLKTMVGAAASNVTADEVVTWLSDPADHTVDGKTVTQADRAKAFAKEADKHKGTAAEEHQTNGTSVTLDKGYYLVVDDTAALGTSARNPAVLMNVIDDTHSYTITSKTSIPTVEKKIWEESLPATGHPTGGAASTGITGYNPTAPQITDNQWNDVGDYDIGDDVPFKLTATVPAGTLANYDNYHVTFVDTKDADFGTPENLKVYLQIGDGEIAKLVNDTTNTRYIYTQTTDGFKVSVPLVGNYTADGETAASLFGPEAGCAGKEVKVFVVYTAKLTAAVAATGKENDVVLDYSNDYTGTGEGETPKDTVVAMTFDFDVNKYKSGDTTKTPIADATFKLYKVTGEVPVGDALKTSKQTDGNYDLTTLAANLAAVTFTDGVEAADTVTFTAGGANSTFTTVAGKKVVLHGLDTGNYILVETKAPTGFNILTEGIPVSITTAEYERDDYTKGDYTAATFRKEYKVNNELSHMVDVENSRGPQLPSTGGMGTTLFTILGLALMAGAGVLLIAKRRTNK